MKSFSRVRLCDATDCSSPGSSIHGIFQARVLEWVAIAFSNVYEKLPFFFSLGHTLDEPICREGIETCGHGGEGVG